MTWTKYRLKTVKEHPTQGFKLSTNPKRFISGGQEVIFRVVLRFYCICHRLVDPPLIFSDGVYYAKNWVVHAKKKQDSKNWESVGAKKIT